ncbi:muskelin-like [Zophobas morio]|uniref:muskelin-like n=1 Tax=Zophobas morio TaxID=2755281 RepID=UPI003082CF45
MQISNEEKALIVFGGKIISSNESPLPYSGMYYYYYEDHQWVPITVEQHNVELMPRVGHSFLYDPRDEHVYIFSGQNANEPMSDFFVYNILKKKVTWAIADVRVEGGPEISFTQRSTIDPFRREIFVFGMHTKKGKREASTENSFWVYFIDKKKWVELASRKSSGVDEPCPRFAHQFVLDTKNKIHYLFGGNAGTERLNDFWSLRFYKVQKEDVIKQALYFIRKQKFLEMSVDDKFGALRYLQACLAETLDQYDEEQLKDFRSLTSHLFNTSMDAERNKFIKIRSTVYETLLKFFPSSIKQPEENLLDLITEK